MSLSTWTFAPISTGFPIGIRTYREDLESGDVQMTEEGTEARRVFLVDWTQSFAFLRDVLGYSLTPFGLSGVSRVLPDLHNEFPQCYAITANRTAKKTKAYVANNLSIWDYASISVGYRAVDYAVLDDDPTQLNELYRMVSRRTIPKADYLQLSTTNVFKWVSRTAPNNGLGSTPGIIVPTKTLEYVWRGIPALPAGLGGDPNSQFRPPIEDKIVVQLGTTNSLLFDTIYPIGTVLFTAAEATMVRPRFDGNISWNIKFYFEVKDHGLNQNTGEENGICYLYDPANMRWDLVTNDGTVTGTRLYQSSDLNQLFVLG